MKKSHLILACCAALLVMSGMVWAETWDIVRDIDQPLEGETFYNFCASPPQEVVLTEGNHQINLKARRVLDDGGLLEAYDVNMHANHQGAKAIGYELVVDENGDAVKPYTRATDADGNFIEYEYSIPGTYNINQQIHRDGDFTRSGTYMCKMVSHGDTPNAAIHWNASMHISEDGEVTHDVENYWCKCTGGGPDVNGEVDCSEWPDSCVPTPF